MSKERTERLLNLLFALMAFDRPVPKSYLRDAIEAYKDSPSDEAFERMFERDKEELRSMGVPIETVEGADGAGGVEGYRVAADEYALPPVNLTPAELAAVGLAARVWEQAALGPAAQSAVRKLEALGVGTVVEGAVGVETRVATAEPFFPVLMEAVRSRRAVRFDYRRPGDTDAALRTVQPWGITSRRGHWYLVGHDVDRDAARVFRLSRVLGDVKAVGAAGAYDVPEGVDIASLIASASPGPDSAAARIRVRAGRAHGLRRRATAVEAAEGGDVLTLGYGDDEALARELVGLGADVVVLEPATLRDAVVRRLSAAAGEAASS
jgi:predicted DNA-binding transcriptional regulator YafY